MTAQNGNILVYPNPSGGVFTLRVNSEPSFAKARAGEGIKNIEVFNILGEKVYSALLLQTSRNQFGTGSKGALNLIDLSKEPNGVYFYKVITEDGSILGSGKLIIQK